ncbi:MAG TPA: hypothetical protein VEU47_19035 [Candidatus Cybelea sp.]|nr:hypothetical protein [Candidatus Cybelea sp.]
MFPFDHHLRHGPVEALLTLDLMHYQIDPRAILYEIDQALRDDPYAMDLRHDREMLVKRLQAK